MFISGGIMRWLVFFLAVCSVFFGCGLFTPRTDFEDPAPEETGASDYLNFAVLIESSGEKFSKLDWYELFDDQFKYVNAHLADVDYDKNEFINHLQQQQKLFPDAAVTWNNTDDILRTQDTIMLSDVGYTIRSGNSTFTGISRFTIVRSSNIWHIAFWVDEPATAPFFSRTE